MQFIKRYAKYYLTSGGGRHYSISPRAAFCHGTPLTTSTGNIARQCFLIKHNFIELVSTQIPSKYSNSLKEIHKQLSVILRVYNSDKGIDAEALDIFCKRTYGSILVEFPWSNITPSLHRLLAHCVELMQLCSNSHGVKDLSEEGLEA